MRIVKQVTQWIRNSRRHSEENAVILMYHRIADLEMDPYQISVSPRLFSKQLDYLLDKCTVMPLFELGLALQSGKIPHRAVAVTFDDGYLDFYQQAYPLLKSAHIPSTVFLPSWYIGNERGFWWDALERTFHHPSKLPEYLTITIKNQPYTYLIKTLNDRENARNAIYRQVKSLSHSERLEIIDRIIAWAGMRNTDDSQYRCMAPGEISNLISSGRVEIGAHTATHPALSNLSLDEQLEEIYSGRQNLMDMFGCEIRSFAYPYGKREDFNSQTVSILKNAGFFLACTSIRGHVDLNSDIFQLKRLGVHNWSIRNFTKYLNESYFL